MSEKFLFILYGNISTTPRAQKIISSLKNQYSIDIIYVNRSDVWKKIDAEFLTNYPHKYQSIDLLRKNKAWLVSSLKNKFAQKVSPLFKNNTKLSFRASDKGAIQVYSLLKKKELSQYRIIFSFSYPSLYPAIKLATTNNIPVIADIEDYHPLEKYALNTPHEQWRRELIFKEMLPQANYLTFASPLIMLHSQRLIGQNPNNQVLINNSFSETDFLYKPAGLSELQLVWFSQNIDFGRGLEIYIPILDAFKHQIHLTLIGNLRTEFARFLKPYSNFVTTLPALPLKALHQKLADFDIGLAIEQKSEDFNKDIALSNKIFAYAQSGLYILASHTQAQNKFLSENPSFGIICRQEVNDIQNKMRIILEQKETLRAQKKQRFNNAKKFRWENELQKIENMLKKLLP